MKPLAVLLLLLIAALLLFALRLALHRKDRGCCGSCSSCSGCANAKKKSEEP